MAGTTMEHSEMSAIQDRVRNAEAELEMAQRLATAVGDDVARRGIGDVQRELRSLASFLGSIYASGGPLRHVMPREEQG